jgi:hypothetical protein
MMLQRFFLAWLFFLGAPLAVLAEAPEEELKECKGNLRLIHDAIQIYRMNHQELPETLSAIFDEKKEFFWCPVARRLGKTSAEIAGRNSADKNTSYFYEFSLEPIPSSLPGVPVRTERDRKRWQMSLVGSAVPLVRCFAHGEEHVLNLSFGGKIYPSPREWEPLFYDVVKAEDLWTNDFWGASSLVRVVQVPPREAATPRALIDLSGFYNASLLKPWLSKKEGGSLAMFPAGVQSFAEIQFDARGIVQLHSSKMDVPIYPAEVKGITVGQRCRHLHFLHAAGAQSEPGTVLGFYRIHFEKSAPIQAPIVYGNEVLSWWNEHNDALTGKDSVLAWNGAAPGSPAKRDTVRLFKTQWQNPRPQEVVASIDFVSALADSAPFLLAITVEP